PSEKRPTTQRPRLMFKCRHTASASLGFALPVKIRIRSKAMGRRLYALSHAGKDGWGGRDRTYECRNQNPVPYHLATPQRKLSSRDDPPAAARPKIVRRLALRGLHFRELTRMR